MENYPIFSTNITDEIFPEIGKIFWQHYQLNKKMRKREKLLKSISEIINKFSKEDLFKDVDKVQLLTFLNSRMYLLEPYDIKKDELSIRLRKIMVTEAMSRILDGLSPEEIKELERSFK